MSPSTTHGPKATPPSWPASSGDGPTGACLTAIEEHGGDRQPLDGCVACPPVATGPSPIRIDIMSIDSDIDYSEHSEIAGLLAVYAFGLDRRDFDRVASVFTEDAYVENVFDAYMPDGALLNSVTIGGSAVADGARQMFTRLDTTQHLVGAQIVEISGATAQASTQVIA